MVPVFITSSTEYSGKTFLAIGLISCLQAKKHSVGYVKPFGKTPVKRGREVYDADAVFIAESLGLEDPLDAVSPFVLTFESQSLLYKGKLKDTSGLVMDAVKSMKKKDFVLIGGAGNLFEGASLGLDAMSLIRGTKSRALMIESWRGDITIDSFIGAMDLMGDNFLGCVINKVPESAIKHVNENVKPFLEKKGITVFGMIKKDGVLESITVGQLNELLNGKVLCAEDRLGEMVENFSIGAMDVDSAINYFRRIPNKAVITGAYRSDIQLAAMETSTKCIILTGGLYTNDVVLGKAESKGIPIISVAGDTFSTIDKIESVLGKTRIREQGKIGRIGEIMHAGFDMRRFLARLK